MPRVETHYDKDGEDQGLRFDVKKLKDAINSLQTVIDIDARTSDPALPTTTAKVFLWYRTDTNKLCAYVNGAVKTVTLS